MPRHVYTNYQCFGWSVSVVHKLLDLTRRLIGSQTRNKRVLCSSTAHLRTRGAWHEKMLSLAARFFKHVRVLCVIISSAGGATIRLINLCKTWRLDHHLPVHSLHVCYELRTYEMTPDLSLEAPQLSYLTVVYSLPSGSPPRQVKKIPSLFDIKVFPPIQPQRMKSPSQGSGPMSPPPRGMG